jgi:hypothetical protein
MRISTKITYLVKGDHPILKRMDEKVVGFPDAQELARELVIAGYEVTMDEVI